VREDLKDWLLLMGKSVLFVLGGILVVAGLVDLVVAGLNLRAGLVLLAGLLLGVPPLALAFRDAVRAARRTRGAP
jgi:hypothetical protein